MDATMENKMGLPPPYEPTAPAPEPPPSYFGNSPPPPAGATPPRTVVTSPAPTVVTSTAPRRRLGHGPTGINCPSCNKFIVTRVDYAADPITHAAAGILCLVSWCCCACLFPYCIKSCKTAHHYCPECKAFVGDYKSFDRK